MEQRLFGINVENNFSNLWTEQKDDLYIIGRGVRRGGRVRRDGGREDSVK